MRFGMALTLVLGLLVSCANRRAVATFRVLPARPDYLLRSPDSKDIPFQEVLSRHSNVGPGWVELRPQMELRIENAYFREGMPKHGLANFLGTEVGRYHVLATGVLEQIAVESRLAQRPADQPPVQELLSASQRLYGHHRLFYQIVVNKKADVHSAVLLSAESMDELERLTRELINEPESVCSHGSAQCTAFPEACTASLEIEIRVNGAARTVLWGRAWRISLSTIGMSSCFDSISTG